MKEKNSVFGNRSNGPEAQKDAAEFGYPNAEASHTDIRQFANYTRSDKPAPDNNPFWEDGSNPLSSKGN